MSYNRNSIVFMHPDDASRFGPDDSVFVADGPPQGITSSAAWAALARVRIRNLLLGIFDSCVSMLAVNTDVREEYALRAFGAALSLAVYYPEAT